MESTSQIHTKHGIKIQVFAFFTSSSGTYLKWSDMCYSEDGETILENIWKQIDGKWYYFCSYGEMPHDRTIDGYHLGSSCAWTN